jgi:hypothetical protein
MTEMVSISFVIYLAALLLSPPIAAYYAGFRTALLMAFTEVVIVIGAWLFISVLMPFILGTDWLVGPSAVSAGGAAIGIMAVFALGSVTALLFLPLGAIAAGAAIAALGCGIRNAWRG